MKENEDVEEKEKQEEVEGNEKRGEQDKGNKIFVLSCP
jgi:hypothetical protein